MPGRALPLMHSLALYGKCRIAFEALDNGILSCKDPEALQRICDGLDGPKIDRLLRKWLA
jgi:hypothetical protein